MQHLFCLPSLPSLRRPLPRSSSLAHLFFSFFLHSGSLPDAENPHPCGLHPPPPTPSSQHTLEAGMQPLLAASCLLPTPPPPRPDTHRHLFYRYFFVRQFVSLVRLSHTQRPLVPPPPPLPDTFPQRILWTFSLVSPSPPSEVSLRCLGLACLVALRLCASPCARITATNRKHTQKGWHIQIHYFCCCYFYMRK